jgi:hypothetical protein
MTKVINFNQAKNWIKENFNKNDEILFNYFVNRLSCIFVDEKKMILYGNGKYKLDKSLTKSGKNEFLPFTTYKTMEDEEEITVTEYHFDFSKVEDVMYFWLEDKEGNRLF